MMSTFPETVGCSTLASHPLLSSFSSFRLLLWDCDDRTYKYCIEVSCDQRIWKKVVDKSKETCRSWQVLKFPSQPVTFIKIIGTHNTANEVNYFRAGYFWFVYHFLGMFLVPVSAGVSCGTF